MTSIATIQFQDADAQDEALVVVRAGAGSVVLGLSLKSDGDIEVVMPPETAEAVIRALQDALVIAKE